MKKIIIHPLINGERVFEVIDKDKYLKGKMRFYSFLNTSITLGSVTIKINPEDEIIRDGKKIKKSKIIKQKSYDQMVSVRKHEKPYWKQEEPPYYKKEFEKMKK